VHRVRIRANQDHWSGPSTVSIQSERQWCYKREHASLVEGNQDKKRTFGTGKFDRKHYRLIMVMELRVQVWNLQGRVDFKVKAIDSDKFDVYAFHQVRR
jgi:hypothetical protein